MSLHLSKCNIVGNHISRLKYVSIIICVILVLLLSTPLLLLVLILGCFFPPIVSNLPMSKLDCPSLLLRNGNKSEMKDDNVSLSPGPEVILILLI